MAILKCKMCGGDIEVIEETTVMECEYCGSKQTIPSVDDEKLVKLYTRANRLRMNSEFDKAYSVYENIVAEYSEEAEAYWGLILCRYGIEYVDDPATGDKIPTCHRSSFDSIMEDEDFEMVMEYSDGISRRVYREQAKQLEEIRKGIIEVSGKEEPYDLFICYKETAENGDRTIDSVMAQDVYSALTEKGYRVFFSRITLEDKLGQEYEPYIFAALNSAKVMLAFGTDYDYYNAVWVKNEWSRYLKLMAKDKEKHLIPCYKNIDAYDMPKEFARLQAQDLGKVGATQDLLRGIDKIFGRGEFQSFANNSVSTTNTASVDIGMSALNAQTVALLKRGNMTLEDGDYERANDFFEQVLNNDAECSQAYWGKVLCEKKVQNADALAGKIFLKIQSNEKTTKVVLPAANLPKLARQADRETGYLAELSDKVLAELLSDLRKEISYQDALTYYEKVKSGLNESKISQYINNRDYDRALQYADEQVRECKEIILNKVKELTDNAITKEHEKVADANNMSLKRDESIESTITRRLSKITEIYEQKKTEYEVAKRKAEEKAEADYQEALKKHESDYQRALKEHDDSYQLVLDAWKKAKADFEENGLQMAARKAELEGKVATLRTELANVKGLFAGRKKKEIENNINILQGQIDTMVVPTDPGAMPAKGETPIKGMAPSRDDFKAVIEDNDINLLTWIKCELSPSFKKIEMERIRKEKRRLEEKEKFKQAIKIIRVGETISFGNYPYDENGNKRSIEWRVLEKTSDKILLITKDGINSIEYHEKFEDITWEKCTLRSWLNGAFVNQSFDSEERGWILSSEVKADKNPVNSTDPGRDTKDKVFLLSIPESKKYFANDQDRTIKPTPYAKKNGAYVNSTYVNSNSGNASWWLRSPGHRSSNASGIHADGSVSDMGYYVSSDDRCIRPALWLDISDL